MKIMVPSDQKRKIILSSAIAIMLVFTGCGGYIADHANGTDRQVTSLSQTSTPNFSNYSGAGQPDDEISEPTPLAKKTPRNDINVSSVENLLFKHLNHHRGLNSLSEVRSDPRLGIVARHHSHDMATRDFFNHTNPDGQNHGDRLEESSYKCFDSAENIHWTRWKTENRTTEEELAYQTILAFMESAPHNEAMLVPQYDTVGIGIYVTEDGQVFVTMLLCV